MLQFGLAVPRGIIGGRDHGIQEEPFLQLTARGPGQLGEPDTDAAAPVGPYDIAGGVEIGLGLRQIQAEIQNPADLPGGRGLNRDSALADVENLAEVEHHIVRAAVEAGVGRGVDFLANGPPTTTRHWLEKGIDNNGVGPQGLHGGWTPHYYLDRCRKERLSGEPEVHR